MQTLHTRNKVCKVCMPDFCRIAHSGKVCKVHQMHTFTDKCALIMDQVCSKCAECACILYKVCIRPLVFPGKIPGVLKLQT
jgi:hypothetical protein